VSETEILLTAGVAALIFAVVGGGARAFGMEVPVLNSRSREVALALVGVAFLGGAVFLDWQEGQDDADGATVVEPDPEVAAYRQHVLAACETLSVGTGTLPPSTPGFEGLTYDKDEVLVWMRDERRFARRTLAPLWQRPVPEVLAERQKEARAAGVAVLSGWATTIEQLDGELPDSWTVPPQGPQPAALRQALQELAALGQGLRGAMGALADRECGKAATTDR
jgi:hypothetical protein